MQLHELQPKHKPQKKKRKGRGDTYAGKGIKGQNERAGTRKNAPAIRRLFKKYHKLRGFQFNQSKKQPLVVNVKDLERNFQDGDTITPEKIRKENLIDAKKGQSFKVKILGMGRLTKKLTVKDCLFSKSAEEKIKKAGGKIE
jgi:large subunit ribosomal protein L15